MARYIPSEDTLDDEVRKRCCDPESKFLYGRKEVDNIKYLELYLHENNIPVIYLGSFELDKEEVRISGGLLEMSLADKLRKIMQNGNGNGNGKH